LAGPADNCCRPYRTLGHFAQFAGIAHIGHFLIAEFTGGLAIWSVVRGEDDDGILFNAKFFERVEYFADVVVSLRQN
jgi:hypothetical protein